MGSFQELFVSVACCTYTYVVCNVRICLNFNDVKRTYCILTFPSHVNMMTGGAARKHTVHTLMHIGFTIALCCDADRENVGVGLLVSKTPHRTPKSSLKVHFILLCSNLRDRVTSRDVIIIVCACTVHAEFLRSKYSVHCTCADNFSSRQHDR